MDPSDSNTDAASLHAVVNSYLSTLIAVGDCLDRACPPVGGPYRHRLHSIERRLEFDSSFDWSKDAIEEAGEKVARELQDYAGQAAAYLRCHETALRQAAAGLEEVVATMARRQEFYAARLLLFAEGPAPAGADLKACVATMCQESQSLTAQMRGELAAVEERLSEFEVTDPATGLTNRREMERRIRAASAEGLPPVLIRFELSEPAVDEVARQVGARIASQFRYNDLTCRWSDREFLVLFDGPLEVAEVRSGQVGPWVAGRYMLENGEIANIRFDRVQVETRPAEDGPAPAAKQPVEPLEPVASAG